MNEKGHTGFSQYRKPYGSLRGFPPTMVTNVYIINITMRKTLNIDM